MRELLSIKPRPLGVPLTASALVFSGPAALVLCHISRHYLVWILSSGNGAERAFLFRQAFGAPIYLGRRPDPFPPPPHPPHPPHPPWRCSRFKDQLSCCHWFPGSGWDGWWGCEGGGGNAEPVRVHLDLRASQLQRWPLAAQMTISPARLLRSLPARLCIMWLKWDGSSGSVLTRAT